MVRATVESAQSLAAASSLADKMYSIGGGDSSGYSSRDERELRELCPPARPVVRHVVRPTPSVKTAVPVDDAPPPVSVPAFLLTGGPDPDEPENVERGR